MQNRLTDQAGFRPFLPAKDLELSKRFYLALGFTLVLDSEVKIFKIGPAAFVLAAFDKADNHMMQLMVDDLDAWWAHLQSLHLSAEFGVPDPTPPQRQPWGLRVSYLVDPSGILWHIAERRHDKPHDY